MRKSPLFLSCLSFLVLGSSSVAADTYLHRSNPDLSAPQVVGGAPVSPGQFPFLVAVIGVNGGLCTGSLVRQNWVLTAAHCGEPAGVLVTDALQGAAGPTHVVHGLVAKRWFPHPGFNESTAEDDIALVELVAEARDYPPTMDGAPLYTPEPIDRLDDSPSSDSLLVRLFPKYIAGFGLTTPNDPTSAPAVANWASGVPAFFLSECLSFYGPPLDSSTQMCFGDFPHTCQGDSGSAVFEMISGQTVQVGIVSFGSNPCGVGPSVATFVPGYRDWIDGIVGAAVAPTPTAHPISLIWELPPKKSQGVASGVSNAQGIAFSSAGTITSIELFIDGKKELTLPWPSERGDSPGPVLSGFSAAFNWGRPAPGDHEARLVVKDSAGNTRTETRTIETVKILPGASFLREFSADDASCGWISSDTFECTGLEFDQGTCNGSIRFRWSNGKQAMQVVQGCD